MKNLKLARIDFAAALSLSIFLTALSCYGVSSKTEPATKTNSDSTKVPQNAVMIATILPKSVSIEMSPYPTVVMVMMMTHMFYE